MSKPEGLTIRSASLLLLAISLLLFAAGAIVRAEDERLVLGDALQQPVLSAPVTVPAIPRATDTIFLPLLVRRPAEEQLPITRAESQQLFDTLYAPFGTADRGWTGNHESCDAGTTSAAFRQEVLNLVRYFRTMAGVPADIVFDDTRNAQAQQAALMMSANDALSHNPPPDWKCYTEAGAEAAAHANLSWWYGYGSEYHGVLGQMADSGAHNYAVGHRRWILCPQTETMGTGDIPETGGYAATNALWVIDTDSLGQPRPATRDGFVAWPPPGYVPAPVVYDRWSFSYPGADFGAATVTMQREGSPVALALEPLASGYCESTLVWVPAVDWDGLDLSVEQRFEVKVAGVGTPQGTETFTYAVVLFAP